jgi:2-keto-4-pentenoate hydratase/2-oxohepta-3-ene-1,7-dioic acid hydratase in catechol pathway
MRLRSFVNGEIWQDSSTAEMVFDVATIVAFASRTITLEPGDVIATGTPAGVGHYQQPPRYLSDGDLMRCEIEGIGAVENPVVDAAPRIENHGAAAGIAPVRTP